MLVVFFVNINFHLIKVGNYNCENPQTVSNKMHYHHTVNIVGILAISRLITQFCCRHNLRRIARGYCNNKKCGGFCYSALLWRRFVRLI